MSAYNNKIIGKKDSEISELREKISNLEKQLKRSQIETQTLRENFEKERESFMETIGKQKTRLKRLESVREIMDGTRGGTIRELIEKVETAQSENDDLRQKLDEKEDEIRKLREFYQKTTFLKLKKPAEIQKKETRQVDRSQSPQPIKGEIKRAAKKSCEKLQY